MISIRRVSLGGGYRYLMDSVAVGDGAPERTNNLARYYTESGTPPGIFLGGGLADIDGGKGVEIGSQVSEEHLKRMLADCTDPISGSPIGSIPRAPAGGVPVAGFDLTFSPSKSVSVAWALADEGTKALIYECHRRAIDFVLAYGEKHVFHSRSGSNGIIEEDVTGVIAASFTHFTSRSDDPQLHDHVVIWNRARSKSDGNWRTLDSRAIFRATTTLSELHQGVLSDYLTEALGVGWESRKRRHSPRPRYEILGVSEALMDEFSNRAAQISAHKNELIDQFVRAHGRQPTVVEEIHLRQVSTLATRETKSHLSLSVLAAKWSIRAEKHIDGSQYAWLTNLRNRNDLPLLRADDLASEILNDAARSVVESVSQYHSTFTRMNLLAEAHRVLHGVRFVDPEHRVAVAETICDLAASNSLCLNGAQLHHIPERYLNLNSSSRFISSTCARYTTEALLDAETRLLESGRDNSGPSVKISNLVELTERNLDGKNYRLSFDQALAVENIAASNRVVDVLVGPAGTGKSTTMAGLLAVWEKEYGKGSVIGLAPSSAAAEVLATELGIETENTAKWLAEWRKVPSLFSKREKIIASIQRQSYPKSSGAKKLSSQLRDVDKQISERLLKLGQLIIVDEASLAGTFALDELVSAAKKVHAKVLLVGDWAQLSPVEAGGAFSLLVKDRGDLVPELNDIRRFESSWEKTASTQLRIGDVSSIEAYDLHGRIAEGTREELLDAIYQAWKTDRDSGKTSLMIAGDALTVSELNRRARADQVSGGRVSEEGLKLGNGNIAGVGDEVVTRQNNRLLNAGKSYVKNGDRWKVTAVNDDGSMAVQGKGIEVVLPRDYVKESVELDYASTAHRAQGRTVDTSHSLVSPTTTREVLYVAATRGKQSNNIYVDTSFDPDPATSHSGMTPAQNYREVLTQVLRNEGRDVSATETIASYQVEYESLKALLSEYLTLASVAQAERFNVVLETLNLRSDQLDEIRESEAFGALLSAIREAEAYGFELDSDLPKLVNSRPIDSAENLAALLHGRVDNWVDTVGSSRKKQPRFIVGLIPRALNIIDPDMKQALAERERAIEICAIELAEKAINDNEKWVSELGLPANFQSVKEVWMATISTIAAYRDYWNLGDHPSPIGSEEGARTLVQASQRVQVKMSIDLLKALPRNDSPETVSFVASLERTPDL
ncbi:MAG: relaxase domain-containing protein [Acidimicrobiales bacterium]|nr:relaxase domain-containing protein [Acidimicrobiales bacterium]